MKTNIQNLVIYTTCPEERELRKFVYCGEKVNGVEIHRFRCQGEKCGREYTVGQLTLERAKEYKRELIEEQKRGCRR